jgi:hypothetical protein
MKISIDKKTGALLAIIDEEFRAQRPWLRELD